MYARNDPQNFLAHPDDIADRMIRGLVLSNFDLVSSNAILNVIFFV